MEEGVVPMVGMDKNTILQGLELLLSKENRPQRVNLVNDYADENISEKIATIILSYTSYVNRKVWAKT